MAKIVVPAGIDTRLYNTLRQIVRQLDRQEEITVVQEVAVTPTPTPGGTPFEFGSEDAFRVIEGQVTVATDMVTWRQGDPVIDPFGLSDITIEFYRDMDGLDRIVSTDTDFDVGGEALDTIVSMDRFTDNLDGTGNFRVLVDARMIDVLAKRLVYMFYVVDQPAFP